MFQYTCATWKNIRTFHSKKILRFIVFHKLESQLHSNSSTYTIWNFTATYSNFISILHALVSWCWLWISTMTIIRIHQCSVCDAPSFASDLHLSNVLYRSPNFCLGILVTTPSFIAGIYFFWGIAGHSCTLDLVAFQRQVDTLNITVRTLDLPTAQTNTLPPLFFWATFPLHLCIILETPTYSFSRTREDCWTAIAAGELVCLSIINGIWYHYFFFIHMYGTDGSDMNLRIFIKPDGILWNTILAISSLSTLQQLT